MDKVKAPPLHSLDPELVEQFQREASSVTQEEWFEQLGSMGQMAFLVIGLSQEAGEVQEIYKKWLARGAGLPKDLMHLAEELGDVLWHIAVICTLEGLSLTDVMGLSMCKFRKRYPHRFLEEGAVV